MQKIKSFLFLLAALILFTASSITVSAAGNETPADIVARLTGRDVTDVIQEKLNTGKTYGTIAKEAGKLDEFKAECLELKEQILKENVANGLLSQDEADDILAAIKENQAICDGTGNANCWNGTLDMAMAAALAGTEIPATAAVMDRIEILDTTIVLAITRIKVLHMATAMVGTEAVAMADI